MKTGKVRVHVHTHKELACKANISTVHEWIFTKNVFQFCRENSVYYILAASMIIQEVEFSLPMSFFEAIYCQDQANNNGLKMKMASIPENFIIDYFQRVCQVITYMITRGV